MKAFDGIPTVSSHEQDSVILIHFYIMLVVSSYTFAGTLSRKTVGFTTDKEDPCVKVLAANAGFERLRLN
jgi:uncharacterized membrane protein